MINKTRTLILTLILSICSAQVVLAQTIYSNYVDMIPYQHCYTKQVYVPHNGFSAPTIAGGIAGGLIGNQFGKGDGKTILTVAGVLLGSSIGSDMGYSGHGYIRNVRRCETRYRKRFYNPPPIRSNIDVYISYGARNY